MTKFEMLQWGVKHIAENHGFTFLNEEDGEHVFTIFGNNIPTLADVRMMCEDLGIDKEDIYHNTFGIDIFFGEWYYEQGDEEIELSNRLWMKHKA